MVRFLGTIIVCLVTDCRKMAETAVSENSMRLIIQETESVYLSDVVKSKIIADGELNTLREIVMDQLEAEYEINKDWRGRSGGL